MNGFSGAARAFIGQVRTIGEILVTPAAILPLAGLLIMAGDVTARLGLTFSSVLTMAGSVLIDLFPLLVAVSLAYGLADGKTGSAALAGALAFLVFSQGGSAMFSLLAGPEAAPSFSAGLFGGFVAGMLAAALHNRCRERHLPEWLSYFSGCRFSALLSTLASLLAGLACGALWAVVQPALQSAAVLLAGNGSGGAFAYGFLNRLLLPFGLHEAINQTIWHDYGEFTSLTGQLVTGELGRFMAGDPLAGRLTAGFLPMVIFALPAIALALTLTARRSKRRRLVLLMALSALVALVSGVTEPLEYLILFAAPLLFILYSLLFGLSVMVCGQLQILFGFDTSTGLTGLLAGWPLATNPNRIWQVGIALAVLTFAVTYFAVVLLKLKTPGRDRPEAEDAPAADVTVVSGPAPETVPAAEPDLSGEPDSAGLPALEAADEPRPPEEADVEPPLEW